MLKYGAKTHFTEITGYFLCTLFSSANMNVYDETPFPVIKDFPYFPYLRGGDSKKFNEINECLLCVITFFSLCLAFDNRLLCRATS